MDKRFLPRTVIDQPVNASLWNYTLKKIMHQAMKRRVNL
jgi:hypothetical protein